MHPLYRILDSSVMGRLRARIAKEWAGNDTVFPSDRTVSKKIMDVWRQNPHLGELYFNAFHSPPIEYCEMDKHLSRQQVNKILERIAAKKPVRRVLGEGRIGLGGEEDWACLVLGHDHPNEVAGYYAFVFQDDCLAGGSLAHVSIVPPSKHGPCIMGIQSTSGWIEIGPRQVNKWPALRATMLLLQHELEDPPNPWSHGLGLQSVIPPPPEDREYMRLVELVAKNLLKVTHASVAMKDVVAHDINYLKNAPVWQDLPLSGSDRMVVFWRDGKFVMCDDYPDYCRHISHGSERAKVAILGGFPSDKAEVECTGGKSLLPPPGIAKKTPVPLVKTEEDKAWLAHNKLRKQSSKAIDSDLMATWLVFARHIADYDADEKRLHKFILERPVVLSEFGEQVSSEVSLDGKYFVDLLVKRDGFLPRVWLIELEQANHRIITQGGQETKEVTHAVQQVSDWLRWWRSHSDHPLVSPTGSVEPKGVVIIGRSSQLTAEDRLRLLHNNQNRNVEVISYDELLDKFGAFILSQLSDKPSLG